VAAIHEGLEGFNAAVKGLEDARANARLLSTRLATATEAWDRQIEKTWGALVVEVGRTRAEGFFPRVGSRRQATPETPEPIGSEPTS
jgi:hypothetical protein